VPFDPSVTERRVTTAIVEVLAEAGVQFVFGMPGGYTQGIFSALFEHPTIRTVQVREESIGSAAAEAYGRLTGKLAVVMGQGEWIVGNAGQGTLEALLGCAPVLILTEMTDGGAFAHHGPYQGGTGDYGAWSAEIALHGVAKRVMVARYPAQAVQQTQLAIKHALTGEPGPVAVIYHSDALRGTVDGESLPKIYPTGGYLPRPSKLIDTAAITAAATALDTAKAPVIIAGNGVRLGQGYADLLELARKLDAPVVTTTSGKGVIVETDPLSLGVIGPFGHAAAIQGVNESDVVLAIGTKLGTSDTADQHMNFINPARQTLIQADVEPLNIGWTFPVDHALVGEASIIMNALKRECNVKSRSVLADERVSRLLDRYDEPLVPEVEVDVFPLAPHRLVSVLQEMVPSNTIVTCDAGENRLFMMHWFKSVCAGGYLQPGSGGGMGYAVPAALGAKLARPSHSVVAVCGDGGFGMCLHALLTAVQERIGFGVVIFDNSALGWILHGMGRRAVGANFASFDYAAIARSMNCESARPENIGELRDAMKMCTDPRLDRPFVVDVATSLETSFRDLEQFSKIVTAMDGDT